MTDLFDRLRVWQACNAPHGTTTRYQAGCPCERCRLDHALVKQVWGWEHLGKGQMDSYGDYLHREPVGPWSEKAACKGCDPELWHPSGIPGVRGTTKNASAAAAQAKQICRVCPVRAECLQHALEQDERLGVWGGMSPLERERYRNGLRRKCIVCGELFAAETRNRQICSEACRKERHRQQKHAHDLEHRERYR